MIEIIGGIIAVVLFVVLLPVILQLAAAATAVMCVLGVLAATLTLVLVDDEIRVFMLCAIVGSALVYWMTWRETGPPTTAQIEETRKDARRKRLSKMGLNAPIVPPMPDRSSPEWPDWRDRKGKWVDR